MPEVAETEPRRSTGAARRGFPRPPVLVLSGDLDSLTSPEGARQTADAFPNSTYVEVANMIHVSAISDFDRCASRIVRRFVRTLDAGDVSCAGEYNEMRLVDHFVRSSSVLQWGPARMRTARVAAESVGDVIARWLSMYTYSGTGLRGGTFTTTDGPKVKWRLNKVRWVGDVKVSGAASWDRRNGRSKRS